MVEASPGRIAVIDNERVGTGPIGFDLARTWYRWNLSPAQWSLFQTAYDTHAPARDAAETWAFWRVAVIVQSAGVWLSTSRTAAEAACDRLRELVTDRPTA
jgi:aminoglycoside phosphotransferase (APT) family kinase protein